MRKRSRPEIDGFVLRSGYVVSFEAPDAPSIVDHLKNAILGESLQTLRSKRKKTWEAVAKDIVAEITHLAKTMPPDIAQGLLIALLSDAVFERLRAIAADHGLQAPITRTIQ
jgi:hypothetical protein